MKIADLIGIVELTCLFLAVGVLILYRMIAIAWVHNATMFAAWFCGIIGSMLICAIASVEIAKFVESFT